MAISLGSTLPSTPPQVLKIEAGYGRLYVGGPAAKRLLGLPGAAFNEKKGAVELSLTLEMLRAIRKETGRSKQEFAKFLTDEVLAWARKAGEHERKVNDLHQRIAEGYRAPLPWIDTSGQNRQPYDHQQVMATVAIELDGCAFVCEMGLGKSKAAIESLSYLLHNDKLDLVLVVCPKGVLGTWRRELQAWAMGLQATVLDGSMKNRQKILADPSYHSLVGYPVFITNYDVLYALEPVLVDLAKQGQRIGVVFDEMHKLRNPEARVTRSAMKVSVYSAKWRLGMTGSPILQGAHDIWSQWYVLDLGMTFGANHKQFKREFFDENPYDFSIDAKEGTLDEIGQRMRRIGLRYTKAEVLDLPPKLYESIDVELSKEQRRAYAEMEEYLVTQLRGGTIEIDDDDLEEPIENGRVATAITQVVMMMRLTTITSGFVKDENQDLYLFDPNPKLDILEELVNENIRDQQIIVWARYRENVRAIAERLAKHHPVIIQGGQKQHERDHAENSFQSGHSRLLVANPAAGGVGLNLQAASLAIYYSQGYSLEHRIQSEDRCHRSGSERHSKVTYIDLLATNTIDGVVADALAGKKSVADMVVDLRKALGV